MLAEATTQATRQVVQSSSPLLDPRLRGTAVPVLDDGDLPVGILESDFLTPVGS